MVSVLNRFARRCGALFAVLLLFAQVGPALAQDELEEAGVSGNTYTSPTFGYSLSWDESIWSVSDALTDNGYDFLMLQTEVSDLYVEGLYLYRGDPAECLEGERLNDADLEGLDDLDVATDDDGYPIEEIGDDYAYGMYLLPDVESEDGETVAYVYLECQTLIPDSVVLVVTAYLDAYEIDSELTYVSDLLESFSVGAPPDEDFDPAGIEQVMRDASLDVDAYWAGVFDSFGETYEKPKYITFTGPVETECGDAQSGESGPFYCPSDRTVYLDLDVMGGEILPFGEFVVDVVIAHEIGHHVQELLGLTGCTLTECGVDGSSLAIELQADCLAGTWTQDAVERDYIRKSDVKRIDLAVKTYLGDPPDTPMDDPEAHGSGELRDELFQAGYTEGLSACGLT